MEADEAEGVCPDADQDGVCDDADRCPFTPAGCRVDALGCPIDSDRDGVCDGVDQCPNTMIGCRVDERGCPIDSDGDDVCDGLDLCPNTPRGVRVDKDGCPMATSGAETELLEKGVITVRDIYFDTAKWDIKPESEQTLNELCTIFKQHPELRIEIGGHADARGSSAYNQDLTEKRAEAVLDWMRSNCADANLSNFTSRGYGETRPVGSNSTTKGMALNRRIEFKVLNTEMLKRGR
jgi:OOP family OmpA-OmpF porin